MSNLTRRRASLVHANPGNRQLAAGGRVRRSHLAGRVARYAKFNEDEPRDEHGRWTAAGSSVGGRLGATLGAIAGATAGFHTPQNVREATGRTVGRFRGAATGALIGATLRGKPLAGARHGSRIGGHLGSAFSSSRVGFAIAGASVGSAVGRRAGQRAGEALGRRIAALRKYSDSEARDDHGRWAGGGAGGADHGLAPHHLLFKPDAVARHVGTLTGAVGSVLGGAGAATLASETGPGAVLAGLAGNYAGDTIGRALGERLTSAIRSGSIEQLKAALLGTRVDMPTAPSGRFAGALSGAAGGELTRRALPVLAGLGARYGANYLGGKVGALGGTKAKLIGEILGTAGGEYGGHLVRHLFGKRFDFRPTAIRKEDPYHAPSGQSDGGQFTSADGSQNGPQASSPTNPAGPKAVGGGQRQRGGAQQQGGAAGAGNGGGQPQLIARPLAAPKPPKMPDEGKWTDNPKSTVFGRALDIAGGIGGGALRAAGAVGSGALSAAGAVGSAALGTAKFGLGTAGALAGGVIGSGFGATPVLGGIAGAIRGRGLGGILADAFIPGVGAYDGFRVGANIGSFGYYGKRRMAKRFDFRPAAIAKQAHPWTVSCKILKADAPKGLVYGWASVIEKNGKVVTDHQGDRIASDELVKAAHDYVTHSRAGKIMHKGKEVGRVVESMVFTKELQKALGVDLGRVGWLVGYQITDPDAKAEFQKGKLRAFSIGGSGVRTVAAG